MITKMLISKNYTEGGIKPEGLIAHSTANPGATAKNHFDYWNRENVGGSAHFISDWNEKLQVIEEFNRAWHAGYTANRRFLGWEICEPPKGDVEKFNRTYWNAVNGIAELFKAKGWNTTNNLWSHAWASNTFHETDHQDPYPFFKEYGVTWEKFCNDIDNAIAGDNSSNIENTESEDDCYMSKLYQNGSTKEVVYSDSDCTMVLGSLDPYESCTCIYEWEDKAVVLYKVTGTDNEKVGFVKWTGGIK